MAFDETNFMKKKPDPIIFKIGDRVKVVETSCCNQFLGNNGIIVSDEDWGDGPNEVEFYVSMIGNVGKELTHGYTSNQLELLP